ncbi:hypothetical protein HY415_01695 [Candidatus Kaiserbacteria bacterium]|nr:hypothetical protein [Candidatus Kaiserbacteria bacterium]
MGKIEASAQKKRKKRALRDIVLATVAASGLLAVAAVTPNVGTLEM